ncbi:MAG: thiamine pyrophosphate-binding protein [bacterium]|nr:thiamine pyrophosphate-binding protein [bacterium]
MKISGARLVVQALEDEGVRYTFGIPGTHNIELYDALADSSVEPVLVTDERSASFLVDGFARSSQSVGVLNVVPGAGVTHAMSGIAEAFMDNVPMVVLACGIRSDTGAAYQLHAIDQCAVLRPVTKAVFQATNLSDVYPMVRRAFELARQPTPGPVVVEIPANLYMLVQQAPEIQWEGEPEYNLEADGDLVEAAAKMLVDAEHPALYVGAGCRSAADGLVHLAERLGAPVATTVSGKGVFPEHHPLWLWNGIGNQAPQFVQKIMDNCDCLLAIGCRFSEVATGSYGIDPPEQLIHVDSEPEVFNRNYKAALTVPADAASFVEALLEVIDGECPWPELATSIRQGHAEVSRARDAVKGTDRVSPFHLFSTLQRVCSEDVVFTADSGNGTFLAMEYLRLNRPGCFLAPVDFSCMGYSVPAAIGAAFADREREVVALAGDGAFLMTGIELLTAAENDIGLVVCVLRDGKLGQIAQFQKIPMNRETCSKLPDYSVEQLARGVGCRYFRAVRDHELVGVLTAALDVSRLQTPVVVEVAIDYSQKTFFTRGVVKTNFWRLPWGDRLRMLGRAAKRRL